jgi:hypothetical protein
MVFFLTLVSILDKGKLLTSRCSDTVATIVLPREKKKKTLYKIHSKAVDVKYTHADLTQQGLG